MTALAGERGETFTLLPFCRGAEELNVLKSHLRVTIATLLGNGTSQHEIHRRTGVDRKTIRRYARESGANSPMATGSAVAIEQIPPPRPPAPLPRAAASAFGGHMVCMRAHHEGGDAARCSCATCGRLMPRGSRISPASLQAVPDWITAGANP